MEKRKLPAWVLATSCSLLIALWSQAGPTATAGLQPPPAISDQVLASFSGADLTINGSNFGLPTSARSLQFSSPEGTFSLPASSPLVQVWNPAMIRLQVPPQARIGSVAVVVDGQHSAPVDLYVYVYTSTSTHLPGSVAHPLALAVGQDHRVWVEEEFQSKFKALTPDLTPYTQTFNIPQAPGIGIFSYIDGDIDQRTRISSLGEDVDVEPDGTVWFAQGGEYLYFGENLNTSRIVQYRPQTGQFSCFVVPTDNAAATSVLVDRARGMVWYTEAALYDGNAIGGFDLATTPSDCMFNPDVHQRPPLCSLSAVPGCHARFVLPSPNTSPMHLAMSPSGDIWYTGYWSNRIGRLDPDTGAILELPLPEPIVQQGPGVYVGAGPGSIEFDDSGDLWFNEAFDATINRVKLSSLNTFDCSHLDVFGQNPCIEEMFVGSNGLDGRNTHTLSIGNDGMVWFTYNGQSSTLLINDTGMNRPLPQVGFIASNHGDTVVLLPELQDAMELTGVVQDRVSGEVWMGQFFDRRVGRLQPAGDDGDGIPASIDNCPSLFNPEQTNVDADFIDQTPPKAVDDATWISSDGMGDSCDEDDDNDGLTDMAEVSMQPCPSAPLPVSTTLRDTDGDGVLDGAECALGTDPGNRGSLPAAIVQPDADGDGLPDPLDPDDADADFDNDRLRDGVEFRFYNSNPASPDSDGDGCLDLREVASLNPDRRVNSIDQGLLASEFGVSPPLSNMDLNKDGVVSSIDQGLQASVVGGVCS